jgi:hypothetical protein
MSNNATTVKNPSASNPVGRPPVVLTKETWSQVTEALRSKTNLATLADTAMVSVPTMRKLLGERFGDRINFARGRNGGVTLVAARRGGTKKGPRILKDTLRAARTGA